ncbi:MAG: hypothetical protein ACKO9V_04555, partial [Candidatus Kapaibacterium sp.]
DRHGHAPVSVSVSPSLYSWIQSMKKEAVSDRAEDSAESRILSTRFGPIPLIIDELLSPYEILVE